MFFFFLYNYLISVQSLSHNQLFATPWITAHQASLSITNSQSPPKPMSIELVMPSNLILCHPLLLLPSVFPSIRVFSNESDLCIRWPKYWSFSFSISPSNEYPNWFPLGWTSWISLQSKGLSRVFSNTAVQKHHQRNQKGIKICIETNENENNNPKPVGHYKSSAKRKVHSNTGIPQETRKKSNK